ncbi:MAG: ChbG/HpnK family deacetylase, partial [Bacteroidales bacterium]
MKTLLISLLFFSLPIWVSCQTDNQIRLLVRGDDIGSFHAANIGCIESYKNGIMQSVEIMVPCPWYPEAVKLLNENPGLDVGVHLVMTSEWENMKWRPLTGISSFTDDQGYFFPMVWPNENFPPGESLRESDWHIDDVESELRAQIEVAKRDIKNL